MFAALALKNVYLDIVFSSLVTRSVLECGMMCYSSSECRSFLFDHRAHQCHLCDDIFTDNLTQVTHTEGINYYHFAAAPLVINTGEYTKVPSTPMPPGYTDGVSAVSSTPAPPGYTDGVSAMSSTPALPGYTDGVSAVSSTPALPGYTDGVYPVSSTPALPGYTDEIFAVSSTPAPPGNTDGVSAVSSAPAPPGYTYASTLNRYYKVHAVDKTWQQAKDACEAEGGFLAMPKTPAERDFYRNIVSAIDDDAFFGGRKYSGNWKWLDGTDATGALEADGDKECLLMDTDLIFVSEQCDDKEPFVCEQI